MIKTRFLSVICLLTCNIFVNQTNAQKQFEGIVTYRLHISDDKDPVIQLTASFSKQGIKLKLEEVGKNNSCKDPTISILRWDSGKVYTLNDYNKTYTTKIIALKISEQNDIPKKIQGYQTHPVVLTPSNVQSIFVSLFMASAIIVNVADDLNYSIPDKYAKIMETVLVQNNKIILGGKIIFNKERYTRFTGDGNTYDTSRQNFDTVTLTAISVEPQQLSNDAFEVPKEYTKYVYKNVYDTASVADDSVAVITDSIEAAPEAVDSVKNANDNKTLQPYNQQPVNSNEHPAPSIHTKPEMIKEE